MKEEYINKCILSSDNRYSVKKIIQKSIAPRNEIPIKYRETPAFVEEEELKYIFFSVKNNLQAKQKLMKMLNIENGTVLKKAYQLYGKYDFCVELKGNKNKLIGIADSIKSSLDTLLNEKDGGKEFICYDAETVYKYNGVELEQKENQDIGAYFIDFEETNCIGAFIELRDCGLSPIHIYGNIKKACLESFVFTLFGISGRTMCLMLLAECSEYYKLNDITEIIDKEVEKTGRRKRTYLIAGVVPINSDSDLYEITTNHKESEQKMNTKHKGNELKKMLAEIESISSYVSTLEERRDTKLTEEQYQAQFIKLDSKKREILMEVKEITKGKDAKLDLIIQSSFDGQESKNIQEELIELAQNKGWGESFIKAIKENKNKIYELIVKVAIKISEISMG